MCMIAVSELTSREIFMKKVTLNKYKCALRFIPGTATTVITNMCTQEEDNSQIIRGANVK